MTPDMFMHLCFGVQLSTGREERNADVIIMNDI